MPAAVHCAVNMLVSMFTFMTRAEVLLPMVNGYDDVQWYMSTWTGVTAALEFIVNPTIGQLSDAYGRKAFLLLAPYANIVLKTLVIARPRIWTLTLERLICDGLRTLCGSTMGKAMMTDIVPRDELAQSSAALAVCMGIGLIGAPALSSALSPIQTFYGAIVFSVAQLVIDTVYLKESLPAEQRKSSWAFTNPFAFTRLFTQGAQLRKLSTVTLLHNMIDIKVTADPMMVFQQVTLGWTRKLR